MSVDSHGLLDAFSILYLEAFEESDVELSASGRTEGHGVQVNVITVARGPVLPQIRAKVRPSLDGGVLGDPYTDLSVAPDVEAAENGRGLPDFMCPDPVSSCLGHETCVCNIKERRIRSTALEFWYFVSNTARNATALRSVRAGRATSTRE